MGRPFSCAKTTSSPFDELDLNIDVERKIASLTLDRPKARNALSTHLLNELETALDVVARDKDAVHVVVLGASGPVFSSGHDLKEVAGDEQSHGTYMDLFQLCSRVMIKIAESEKPIVAKVNGIATAAGCQLVAACDLVVATKNSKFATPVST